MKFYFKASNRGIRTKVIEIRDNNQTFSPWSHGFEEALGDLAHLGAGDWEAVVPDERVSFGVAVGLQIRWQCYSMRYSASASLSVREPIIEFKSYRGLEWATVLQGEL